MMAFPTTPLPMLTELLIGGQWVTVNDGSSLFDRRIADGLTIGRGRRDWSSRVTASQCSQVFENADGKYSNRNPLSPYYGLLGRNTQLRHRIRWVRDTFTRSGSSTWGTTDTGQVWANSGVASDYSTNGSKGFHTLTTVNVLRTSLVALPFGASDAQALVNVSATATGASLSGRVMVGTATNNFYNARLDFTTTGSVTLSITKSIGGVGSVVKAAVTVGTYTPATQWWVRIQRRFGYLRAKAWLSTDSEPAAWTLVSDTTETEIPSFTVAGCLSGSLGGNTNVNPIVAYDTVEVNDYRFWGETSAFSPLWDKSGRNVTVPVDAAGILQRLSAGKRPVKTVMNRAMIGAAVGDVVPIAYWPCEDEAGSTQFASAYSGQPAATFGAGVTPAAYTGIVGSAPLPTLQNGSVVFAFPAYADTGHWQIQFTLMIPSTGFSSDADLAIVKMRADGSHAMYTAIMTFRASTNELMLTTKNAAGVTVGGGTGFTAPIQRDTPYLIGISDLMFGADHNVILSPYTTGPNAANIGEATQLPDGFGAGSPSMPERITFLAGATFTGWSPGHVALYTHDILTIPTLGPNARSAAGNVGERAGDRMIRLCREAGVPFELVGNAADTSPMGPQEQGTLLNLLFGCADADLGRMYEPRDVFGLAYRTGASLYNQTPVALDYAAGHIGGTFQPVEDDQLLANDVTVKRTNGSSTRVEVTTGPLSTQDPPNGVGTYEAAPELNLAADLQTGPLANHLATLGTWDEARFPTVTVEMAAPDVIADGLLATVPGLDIGDTLTVANPPAWLPPEAIGLLVEGTTEYVGTGEDWSLTFNTVPSGPFDIGVYGDTNKPYDNDFTTTSGSLTTTATAVNYTCTSGRWATTASEPAEFPYLIVIDGERMRVNSATATTFNVTRSINGIVKTHAANAPVHVYRPARYGLGR